MMNSACRVLIFSLLSLAAACSADDEPVDHSTPPGGKADQFDNAPIPSTFEEFRAGLYCEPNNGACIVQGDVPIWGDDALRTYYVSRLGLVNGLTVMNTDEVDATWDRTQRYNLTYCVSDAFGDRKDEVIEGMRASTEAWENIADVAFVYTPEHDARCNSRNVQVVFDVTPAADPSAGYIARAFFPSYKERAKREVIINLASHDRMLSDTTLEGDYTLVGVLRHELGHVLGFRHEHIRDEAGAYFCREDENYRPITAYDAKSVMHYPQCNGAGDWGLALTDIDARGAAFFYPDFNEYKAARCDEELDANGVVVESCEPIVHALLELANTASEEVLDDWVKLDTRAASSIIEGRRTQPFTTLTQLYDVIYLGPVSVRRMYEYLYVSGRCPLEIDEAGLVNAQCLPVVNRVLELANTASLVQLDDEVKLDSRAAANIVTIRKERPFSSFAELWDVDYVKTTAIAKMYHHLYPQ